MMLEPEVETRPWAEQLALDDASYRAQLAYLFERSAVLPREARARPGSDRRGSGQPRGHRAAAADREAGAAGDGARPRTRSARTSARRRAEIVRIYSTSGTTGTPELHPAHGERPRQLGHRLRAQLRGLGHPAGQRIVSTYNAGPFVAGRRARGVRPHRPLPHPGRHRQHRAAGQGDRAAEARGRRAHAVVRRLPRRVDRRARLRPPRLERRARPRRGRARRRRAGVPREARGGLGRARDGGDGHRRHRHLALGRVRGAGRHAPRRARLRPRRADRPGDRRRARSSRTARAASSCSRTCGTVRRRSSASARATTSRCGRAPARAAAPARACAASDAPTTCSSCAASTSSPRPCARS